MPPLNSPPKVELDVLSVMQVEPPGFLTLKRYDLAIVQGTERSETVTYDLVVRRAMDAAIIVAHALHEAGPGQASVRHVYLRSAVRPPVGLRDDAPPTVLWEVPAGLIEPGEEPDAGAARELEEELGFRVAATDMRVLGPAMYPAPAVIGELHWFFHVEVDPKTRKAPGGDGSPLEEGATVVSVPLVDALDACKRGLVSDEKTELALRRLADLLG